MVADYGGSDLLCYRAEAPGGAGRSGSGAGTRCWTGPEQALGARLVPTAGVMPVAQPQAALDRLHAQVAALPPFELAPFHDLVALSRLAGPGLRSGPPRPAAGGGLARCRGSTRISRPNNGAATTKPRRPQSAAARDFLFAPRLLD